MQINSQYFIAKFFSSSDNLLYEAHKMLCMQTSKFTTQIKFAAEFQWIIYFRELWKFASSFVSLAREKQTFADSGMTENKT